MTQSVDPSSGTDDTSAPVSMIVNSSDLLAEDFHLVEVSPLQLDSVARGVRRTRDAAVRKLQGVGNSPLLKRESLELLLYTAHAIRNRPKLADPKVSRLHVSLLLS
jgi:hypothetical protein